MSKNASIFMSIYKQIIFYYVAVIKYSFSILMCTYNLIVIILLCVIVQ